MYIYCVYATGKNEQVPVVRTALVMQHIHMMLYISIKYIKSIHMNILYTCIVVYVCDNNLPTITICKYITDGICQLLYVLYGPVSRHAV